MVQIGQLKGGSFEEQGDTHTRTQCKGSLAGARVAHTGQELSIVTAGP